MGERMNERREAGAGGSVTRVVYSSRVGVGVWRWVRAQRAVFERRGATICLEWARRSTVSLTPRQLFHHELQGLHEHLLRLQLGRHLVIGFS